MRSSVEMYEAATGSEAIARFTGGEVTLKATEFPKGSNRAKIATEGFHVDGFVASKDIPVFAARDLAAHRGHVWIAAQRQVRVIDAAPGKLQVEREVTTPMKQTFRAWASCESLTLTEGVPAGWTPPGGARGYLLKKPAIALFDQAGGTTVTTLQRAPDSPTILFFSTYNQGSWVHVEYHGEVIIDAWARAADLTALPPGETMDQLAPSRSMQGRPRLAVQGETRSVRASKALRIRTSAAETGTAIGVVEPGTEIYVLDVVAGWASVLPKALNIAPAGDGQFWVRAPDLGL
jgi:hypothetical protein